jgi:hypothetical protein
LVKVHTVTGIATLREVLVLRRNTRVALALPSPVGEEARRLERRLNGFVSECGCNASAVALTVGVIACVLLDVAHRPALKERTFESLGLNLLACFAAAAVGRFVGRLRAKSKLAQTIELVEAQLGLKGAAREDDREQRKAEWAA